MKKRTFKQLKEGSYFYSASTSGIERHKVFFIRRNDSSIDIQTMKLGISWYTIETVPEDSTEYHHGNLHWFTSKEDAHKKAYELMLEQLKQKEIELENARMMADYYYSTFICK